MKVKASAYPKAIYTGKVYAFDAKINPTNRSLGVRANVPNKKHKLLPGMFVEVTLYAGTEKKIVTVPQTAIAYTEQGNSVLRGKR